MACSNNNNSSVRSSQNGPLPVGPSVDVGAMMTLMQGMVQQLSAQQQNKEVHDQQIALLRDGLMEAQKATATTL